MKKNLKKKEFAKPIVIFFVAIVVYLILRYLVSKEWGGFTDLIAFLTFDVAMCAVFFWVEDNTLSEKQYTQNEINMIHEFDKDWLKLLKRTNRDISNFSERITKSFENHQNDEEESEEFIKKMEKTQELMIKDLKEIYIIFEKKKAYFDSSCEVKEQQELHKIYKVVEFYLAYESVEKTYNAIDELKEKFPDRIETIREIWGKLIEELVRLEEIKESLLMGETIDFEQLKKWQEELQEEVQTDFKVEEKLEYIGISVGDNLYFKPVDKENTLTFTSKNWKDEEKRYSTWYTVPKEGWKSVSSKKDYYFIVRPEHGCEFPFIKIDNENMEKLLKAKGEDEGDYYSFYFDWKNDLEKPEVMDGRREMIYFDENQIEVIVGKGNLNKKGVLVAEQKDMKPSMMIGSKK